MHSVFVYSFCCIYTVGELFMGGQLSCNLLLKLSELQCVRTHVTRSQLELKRARCKISNKGYLSLNIFVILCHNMVIRSWDITTIPKGLSETLFGRF